MLKMTNANADAFEFEMVVKYTMEPVLELALYDVIIIYLGASLSNIFQPILKC